MTNIFSIDARVCVTVDFCECNEILRDRYIFEARQNPGNADSDNIEVIKWVAESFVHQEALFSILRERSDLWKRYAIATIQGTIGQEGERSEDVLREAVSLLPHEHQSWFERNEEAGGVFFEDLVELVTGDLIKVSGPDVVELHINEA